MTTTADLLKDSFLMTQSTTFTASLLEAGMGLDDVCKVVKEYQRSYLLLKNNKIPENMLTAFTTEMWWKSRYSR